MAAAAAAAGTGALVFSSPFSPVRLRRLETSWRPIRLSAVSSTETPNTIKTTTTSRENGRPRSEKTGKEETERRVIDYSNPEPEPEPEPRKRLKDFFQECHELIRSDGGGPPRWFSPLECGSRDPKSPLLLFLPGIDGTGLGLITHHHKLGKIFDMWCLHIPLKDRTSYMGLLKLVEETVRSANYTSPNRPIYLFGESLGGCIALDVAARNPDIDLVLILANPATSFSRSQLPPLIPLLEVMPDHLLPTLKHTLTSLIGEPLKLAVDNFLKGLPLPQTDAQFSEDIVALPTYLSVLTDVLPRETLLWKLHMLKSASSSSNSHLHAVKAQSLILCSGRDQLLPSQEEGQRLYKALPKCEIRRFEESGHFLFLDDNIDLVTVLKGASFYRRGKYFDYVSDFIPPTPSEFGKILESCRILLLSTSPVMFSTLEDGKVVRGLAGMPSEGPVLLVGYHMLLGSELYPLISQILIERNILVRGLAHPFAFTRLKDGMLPEVSTFDSYRIMGAVPVSGPNFYKLLSAKSHILLYPGGMREALHRKGEEYKLFWPEQSEFVRMAARFGAKIVPFGTIGEDDVAQVITLKFFSPKKL
ncbi:hypothetical protein SLEP1_g48257 [Rubroshorea leprosula]|uniref:Serine aminopeptidase S33 domain-containing protein n=3 Tax=Rubroshorea leprosula TaxID=152421 RepID=A0AAV5LVE0_9ROSI|nr:hypothetical protein SLEP1_g48257 [Rubroshorea leprosula]